MLRQWKNLLVIQPSHVQQNNFGRLVHKIGHLVVRMVWLCHFFLRSFGISSGKALFVMESLSFAENYGCADGLP